MEEEPEKFIVQDRNIALLGFMGTGKSTVAALLAQRLGRRVVEMDAVIEQRAGKPISAIFAEEGEPHFRQLERALIRELAAQRGLIISCGGGVVLNPDNVRDLAAGGLVVCLLATPQVVLQRVAAATHRPLLEGGDKAKKILDLLASRRSLYEAVPHRIDTSARTPEEITDLVLALFSQLPAQGN
jgi:shikimate kinase